MVETTGRAMEDLRGSFRYGWLLLGISDVIVGGLSIFDLIECADISQEKTKLVFLCVSMGVSVVAFFSGTQFRSDLNKLKLVNDT